MYKKITLPLIITLLSTKVALASELKIHYSTSPKEECSSFKPPNNTKDLSFAPLNLLYLKCIDQAYDDKLLPVSSSITNLETIRAIDKNMHLISTRLTFLNLLTSFNQYVRYNLNISPLERGELNDIFIRFKDRYKVQSLSIDRELDELMRNSNNYRQNEAIFVMRINETKLDTKIINLIFDIEKKLRS